MTTLSWLACFVAILCLILGAAKQASRRVLWTIAGAGFGIFVVAGAMNYVMDNDPVRHPYKNFQFSFDPHAKVETAAEQSTPEPNPTQVATAEPNRETSQQTAVAFATPYPSSSFTPKNAFHEGDNLTGKIIQLTDFAFVDKSQMDRWLFERSQIMFGSPNGGSGEETQVVDDKYEIKFDNTDHPCEVVHEIIDYADDDKPNTQRPPEQSYIQCRMLSGRLVWSGENAGDINEQTSQHGI